MTTTQYSETNPFFTIPQKKIDNAIEDIKNVHLNQKTGKLSMDGAALLEAIHRYASANIPVDYWFREMDKFEGDVSLVNAYESITKNVRDAYNNGMNFCFAGGHGKGKMLDLDTELPTPNGFVKLKDLNEGDELFDENGNICNITKLHPIDYKPRSYRVTFDDGEIVNACEDHLWLTHTLSNRRKEYKIKNKNARRINRRKLGLAYKPWLEKNDNSYPLPTVKATKDILNTLKVNGKKNVLNHSIPCSRPLKYKEKNLLIDPYILGCWLGDGITKSNTITIADNELIDNIKKSGYNCFLIESSDRDDNKSRLFRIGEPGVLTKKLKECGVLGNKHIPYNYLISSFEQRLSLLQGLMDTDGSCYKSGSMEFCSVIPELAKKTHELALGLGIKSSIKINKSFLNGKRCKDRYIVAFTTDLPVFKLKRKLANIRVSSSQKSRTTHRFIKSIESISPVPMRCITVNSPSHLYLVTRSCIATHNTMAATCALKRVVETGKYNALYVNLTDIVNLMASSSSSDQEIKSEARSYLLSIDFLVIDEFDSRFMGTDNAIDLFGRMLEPVLRSRIQNKLPTILCTNNTNPDDFFNGSLKQSFKSLMKQVKIIPVLGKDHR